MVVKVLILQTQWCKLKNDCSEFSSVFWQWETLWSDGPDTNGITPRCCNQSRFEEVVAAVESGSQVLVGVVLAPGRRVHKGQLLVTVLQLQDPAAQIQAALWGVQTQLVD